MSRCKEINQHEKESIKGEEYNNWNLNYTRGNQY